MEALETLDSLMLAGEKLGSAMHVGVVLILSPPAEAADADPKAYVDKLYEDGLITDQKVDPRLRRHPHRGADTGGIWVWREVPEIDLRAHVHRVTLTPGSGPADLWETAMYRLAKCYEMAGDNNLAVKSYLDIFYRYEQDRKQNLRRDSFYLARSIYDAAHLLEISGRKTDLSTAATLYEYLADLDLPTAEDARRRAQQIRKLNDLTQ